MRTINLTGLFTVLLSLFFSNGAMCQATVANNAPGAGRFLGFNAAGANLDFRTNNITRMRLMENGSATINTGLQTVNYNGFLGLSADPAYWSSSLSPQAPVSLLHLVGAYVPALGVGGGYSLWGYRPWMRDGIVFSNHDLGFIGLRTESSSPTTDISQLVIAWGDNLGEGAGSDVLSFKAVSGTGSGSGLMNTASPDGREIMRLSGMGNVGIGPNTTMYSRLTISNTFGTLVGGYRPWMKTGVFSHESTDNMYVGLGHYA